MQVRELELVHCAKLTTYKASCSGLSAGWERRKDSHWRFPFELSLSLSHFPLLTSQLFSFTEVAVAE